MILTIDGQPFYEFTCPHCTGVILVHQNELNCRIFRHGEYITTNQPIPPHLPKEECDRLAENNLIRGCGKPFRVEGDGDTITAVVCDYI